MCELKLIVLVQLSAYCWQGEIIFKKTIEKLLYHCRKMSHRFGNN